MDKSVNYLPTAQIRVGIFGRALDPITLPRSLLVLPFQFHLVVVAQIMALIRSMSTSPTSGIMLLT